MIWLRPYSRAVGSSPTRTYAGLERVTKPGWGGMMPGHECINACPRRPLAGYRAAAVQGAAQTSSWSPASSRPRRTGRNHRCPPHRMPLAVASQGAFASCLTPLAHRSGRREAGGEGRPPRVARPSREGERLDVVGPRLPGVQVGERGEQLRARERQPRQHRTIESIRIGWHEASRRRATVPWLGTRAGGVQSPRDQFWGQRSLESARDRDVLGVCCVHGADANERGIDWPIEKGEDLAEQARPSARGNRDGQ